MEEEDMQTYPAYNSPHSDVEHPTSVADLNKKRKLLQYESSNSGLPWPKNKIRDRCSTSAQGSSIVGSSEKGNSPEEPINSRIGNGQEHEESDSDSNSCIGTNDSAMSFDAKGKAVESPTQPLHLYQPSTSYCNSSSSVSRNAIYSLESRNISDASNQAHEDMEDNLQVEGGYMTFRDKYPAFGSDDFNSISEYEKDGMEVEDVAYADFMLYSNDVAPNAFVNSSGKSSSGHDARLGTRKPTIDQEFEQYFSTLML